MRIEDQSYDVIVIGGGLLGCFAARSLTRYAAVSAQREYTDDRGLRPLKIALLEKRGDVCTGISRANTAIIYSGCDTKPGTMKTAMCVKAAQNFAALCEELGVRYSACGSIMVCFGERGESVLRKKLKDGTENGVRDMRLLTREEVLALEPCISQKVLSGLYVPDTGTVMPWELCLAAAENAVRNGAEIILDAEVTGIECAESGGFTVTAGGNAYFAKAVVNCAGLSADKLHETAFEPAVRIMPTAGDYLVLDTKASGQIRHVIFHEPEEKGKGLTLVPTVDGNILVGPTERELCAGFMDRNNGTGACEAQGQGTDDREIANQDVHYMVAASTEYGFETAHEGMDLLRGLVAEITPSLSLEHVIRSFGAIRPNPYAVRKVETGGLPVDGSGSEGEPADDRMAEGSIPDVRGTDGWVPDDKSVNDFCIIQSKDGTFISLVGIKTPGLTCANELGMHIAEKIAERLKAAPNARFEPRRPPPARLCEEPLEAREAIVMENPEYGRIVCRCRGISEGEIIDAIHKFPGAAAIDGVKRRTGAGSGRCQGGFCGQSVAEILARELGRAPEDITKDGEGSAPLLAEHKS